MGRWTLFIIVVLVLIIGYLLLVQPALVSDTIARVCPNQHDAECLRRYSESAVEALTKKETTDSILAAFTVILAIATGLLARSTRKLWQVTADTLKHAQETTTRQLRAYVVVRDAKLDIVLAAGSKPKATWEIWNHGQTPAYDVRAQFWLKFEKADWAPPTNELGDERPRFVVNPGTNLTYERQRDDLTLTDEMIKLLKDRSHTIHFWGVVSYRDAFDHQRGTFTCNRLNLSTEAKAGSTYRFQQAPKGNSAN